MLEFEIRAPTLLAPTLLGLQKTQLPDQPEGFLTISRQSPLLARKAVFRLGRFFAKELHYDGQGVPPEAYTNEIRAHLWTCPRAQGGLWAYGGLGFTWRQIDDAPGVWTMEWCWLHPYRRHQGELTRAWAFLRKTYGAFRLRPPLSAAMLNFLQKQEPKEVP